MHRWGEIHFANIAFGQGLTVTPLQMVAAIAAIANGGIYKPPRLALQGDPARRARASRCRRRRARAGEQRVISAETARTMLSIMRGVTGETRHRPPGGHRRATRWRARPAPPRR